MPRYAANLNLQFNEVPMVDRYARAAAAGFTHVEVLFPYNDGADQVAEQLQRHNLELVLFDADPGDFAAGDRGYLCQPGEQERVDRTFREALDLAARLGCRRINVLAGNVQDDVSFEDRRRTALEGLRRLSPLAEQAGVTLLIEALNVHENPRYFVTDSGLGLDLVRQVGSPAVKFQYDAYHLQIMEGNLTETSTKNVADIAHVQIGEVPGRHEPGRGEVDYGYFLAALDRSGYDGYVGLEYRPAGNTEDGLDAWLPRASRSNR
jgi:hydroxypyruvate isomerase